MTERKPWWYSGGDDEPVVEHEGVAGAGSADSGAADDAAETESEPVPSGRDWMALLAGAQRVVDWATARVIAPHSDHLDPREHPDCVVCRTLVVVGDLGARVADATPDLVDDPPDAPPGSREDEESVPRDPTTIAWIPIREGADHP